MDGKYEKIVDNVKEMGRCPKPRRSPRGRPADSPPAVAGVFRLAPGVRRVVSLPTLVECTINQGRPLDLTVDHST